MKHTLYVCSHGHLQGQTRDNLNKRCSQYSKTDLYGTVDVYWYIFVTWATGIWIATFGLGYQTEMMFIGVYGVFTMNA